MSCHRVNTPAAATPGTVASSLKQHNHTKNMFHKPISVFHALIIAQEEPVNVNKMEKQSSRHFDDFFDVILRIAQPSRFQRI